MNTTEKSLFERLALALLFCAIVGIFFWIAYKIREHYSPAHQAAKVLVDENSKIRRSLFAPDDNIQETLLTLIDEEKERIRLAAYSFTDGDIAHALIKARQRGVDVEVIVDGSNSLISHSKAAVLSKHRIPLWVFPSVKTSKKEKPTGIMHDKFVVFKKSLLGRPILWTGSYNFTRSAQTRNQENVIILDDEKLIDSFLKQFEVIKTRCIKMS